MNETKIMRILREANDYSQEYVASILEIEQNTYSKLESGQIRLTVERMKKLAELYHVNPDCFLSDELPVINYNSGTHSKGVIHSVTYNENKDSEAQKELYEKLITEKDQQIKHLQEELTELKKERVQFIQLIEKLTSKI